LVKKRAAWRLYKQYKTENLKAKYKAAERKFSAAVESFNEAKENEIIKSANLGSFYRYINNKLVTKSGVGALKDSNGDLVHDDSDKALVLNDFYSNVFTKDNKVLPSFQSRVKGDVNLNNTDFNSAIVYKHLRQLKSKPSSGPDGLTSFFLKNLAPSLSFPLSILFTTSFVTGEVPDIWKWPMLLLFLKRVKLVTQVTIVQYH